MTAWDTLTFRQHKVEKAFSGDAEGREIILSGKMDSIAKNDPSTTIVTEFAVRIVLERDANDKPLLKLWHAFGGTSYPMKRE